MQEDMRVDKHTTIEDAEETKKFRVTLKFASFEGSGRTIIKIVHIDSEEESVFQEYPLNELVSIKVYKPQKKIA